MTFVFSTQLFLFLAFIPQSRQKHISVICPIPLPSLCNLRRLTKVSVVNSKKEYPNICLCQHPLRSASSCVVIRLRFLEVTIEPSRKVHRGIITSTGHIEIVLLIPKDAETRDPLHYNLVIPVEYLSFLLYNLALPLGCNKTTSQQWACLAYLNPRELIFKIHPSYIKHIGYLHFVMPYQDPDVLYLLFLISAFL